MDSVYLVQRDYQMICYVQAVKDKVASCKQKELHDSHSHQLVSGKGRQRGVKRVDDAS